MSLREALRISCNTVFGHIGAQLGKDKMLAEAEKFGFNSEQFVPVRSTASVFPKEMDSPQTASLSVDLTALGVPGTATVTDLRSGETLPGLQNLRFQPQEVRLFAFSAGALPRDVIRDP